MTNAVIWKVPGEFDRNLSHHEEHEDHEGKTEHIDISSSGPSCPIEAYVSDAGRHIPVGDQMVDVCLYIHV